MKKTSLYIIIPALVVAVLVESTWAQRITKGPYLANPGETSLSIRWESDRRTEGEVLFGSSPSLDQKQSATVLGVVNGFYLYEVHLENLQPHSRYFYQVRNGGQTSPPAHFKTSPGREAPISFVAMGDSRSNHDIFRTIIRQVKGVEPDLIISMGDLVETGGNYQQWGPHYFDPAAGVIDHIPLVSTLGDHETNGDNGELFRHFMQPGHRVDQLWFSYDFGPAHFISLDYRHADNKEMIEWFKKDLAQSDAQWTFVYMHRPSYNLGGHRSSWGRGVWPALFRAYRVDIVFAGHSHQYERFYPVRPSAQPESWPVTYITTGGAGAGLYDVIANPFLAVAASVNHFTYLQISGDTLQLTAYLDDDSVLDHFALIKHQGKYTGDYLALVKPQEKLELATMFARAISLRLDRVPMEPTPARATIELRSDLEAVYVDFEIGLTAESAQHYRLEPIRNRLRKGKRVSIPIEIYSRGAVTISGWGDITPELRLEASYTTPDGEEKIVGAGIEYRRR